MESIASSQPPLSTFSITPINAARSEANIAHAIANVTNSPEKIQFFDNPLISKGFFEALDNVLDCDLTFNDRANLFNALPQDHAQEVSRHYAVKNGNQLQKIWNDKIIQNDWNAIPFLIACNEATDKKIDINVNINNKKSGNTALITATRSGRTKIVRLLLEKGADVNLANDYNQSALMIAAKEGHLKTVEVLLTADDIAVNTQQKFFRDTALIRAAQSGHTEIVRLLLKKGADVNLTNAYNQSALMLATEKGHLKTVEVLLTADDIALNTQKKYSSDTALRTAARSGHTEIVRLLLKKGADVNLTNVYNQSALMLATEKGHLKTVELLLTKPDIVLDTRKNIYDDTALTLAIIRNHEKIVQLLMKKNADIHHTEDELKNAHRIATILTNGVTDIANDSNEIKARVAIEYQRIQIEYANAAHQRVAK